MTVVAHLVLSIILSLVCSKAAAQSSAAPPELVVGEKWTYQAYDGRWEEGSFTVEVREKNSSGYALSASEVTAKNPTLVPIALTLALDWVRIAAEGPTPDCLISFPLTTGRTWACKTNWLNVSGAKGVDDLKFTVIGAEKIEVKAGSFDAIKIVGEGRWTNISRGSSDLSKITVWFAPAARGIVRFQRENWPPGPQMRQPRLDLIRHVIPQ